MARLQTPARPKSNVRAIRVGRVTPALQKNVRPIRVDPAIPVAQKRKKQSKSVMQDEAGQRVAAVMARYARSGSSLALAALAGARTFRAWEHYPRHDVTDRVNATEFYFHAHAGREKTLHEHGHFHVFARSDAGRRFHHIIGISIDAFGMPQRLFLTNQWVTGEDWISASAIAPKVRRFRCEVSGRMAPVAQWVSAMVQLYQTEIHALHRKRDDWWMSRRRSGVSDQTILANPRDQVIAKRRIGLAVRLAQMN